MHKRKRVAHNDSEKELNFDITDTDSYRENTTPEQDVFNSILNEGEEHAREVYGDDIIDHSLASHNLASGGKIR